jgi:hypothetical protein
VTELGIVRPKDVLVRILFGAGVFMIVLGCALLAVALLKIGINDAELGHIHRSGSISDASGLAWGEWRKNDGSVEPFPSDGTSPSTISEFRVGHATTTFFDFTAYEGRLASGAVVAARGPDWGASYRSRWAVSAFIAGILLILAARFRRSHAKV